MDIITNNMNAISKNNPEAYKIINKACCKEIISDANYRAYSETAKDGNLYTIYEYKGETVRLNSAYRPLQEAEKWALQYNITKKLSVIYMFGLGNGYFVRALLTRLKSDSRLIIIEPDFSIIQHVLKTYDLTDIFLDKRVFIFAGTEDEKRFFLSLEQFVHWTNLGSQMFCIHSGYDTCFSENLIRYEEMLRNNNEKEIRNRNTEAHFGKLRVENTLRNLKYSEGSNTLSDLYNKFPQNIPAIIVAAGPSLDKNIEVLKQAKGHAFIIACDTALRYMKKHGVKPDITITVDANKPVRYFEDSGFENLPLFTTSSANYKVLMKGEGRKIWFSGHQFQIIMYKQLGKFLSYRTGGGSVATAAFAVCTSLGFKRIVLVGQDLAYAGEGNVSHAGGEYSRIKNEQDGICYIPGIDGNMVKTRRDWMSFLLWYKNIIKNSSGEFEVIDATEGGALIEGTKIMSLSDVVDKYCKISFDFDKTLTGIQPFNKSFGKKAYEYLMHSREDIIAMEQIMNEAIKTAKECLLKYNQAEDTSSWIEQKNKEFSSASEKIQSMPVYCLVDEYARNETMECVQELCNTTDDIIQNANNFYNNTIKIYEAMTEAVQKIKPLLEELLL